jgi:hypothetical protein
VLGAVLRDWEVLLAQKFRSAMALLPVFVYLGVLENEMNRAQVVMAKVGALLLLIRTAAKEIIKLCTIARPGSVCKPCSRSSKGCSVICIFVGLWEVNYLLYT